MIVLDKLDKQLLRLLSKESAHPSRLAYELRLPRTTISYRLNRLEEFNRAEKFTAGRKTMWRLPLARTHNKGLISVFRDSEFIECYKQISALPKNSIMYAIQGKEAARGEFLHVPEDLMIETHKAIKRKNIIMRGLANQKILDELLLLNKKLRKSHEGRPQSLKLIDEKFLSSGELFVSAAFILAINPSKRIGLIIKEKELIGLFYDLMQILFSLSDRLENFDLNAYIRRIS